MERMLILCYHPVVSALFHRHAVRTHLDQLWRFAVTGGLGFALDLSTLTLLVEAAHIDPRIAVILSSVVGALFVFVVNKLFTFRNRDRNVGNQFLKFLLVYGVAIALNALISNLLIFAGTYYLVAKIVAVGIGAVWNYALSHGFIFRREIVAA